jgi:protein O-GlcNAc transferase
MATIAEVFAIALAHHRAGRLQDAEPIYRRILAAEPNHPHALNNLGVVCKEQRRLDEAVACYRRALQQKPGFAEAHSNLGFALWAQGKPHEAAACCGRAIQLKPDAAEPHNNLGLALKEVGKTHEAAACFRRAVELKPGYAEAHNNLGNALRDCGKLDEAVGCYRRALEIRPDYAEAHNNLGVACKDRGEMEKAVDCARRAVDLRPDRAELHSNLLYALLFCPGYDAGALYEEHRRWNQRHAAPLAECIRPHPNDRSADRRLRIGYASPDFRDHCQSFFTMPLFSSHDREGFEIVCYSDVVRGDRITERLRSHADIWRNTAGLDHNGLAERIRADRIDILVDLTMHMARNRLLTFARKPAPVQVCWLACPGTTGMTAIDYRFTDPHLDPAGMFEHCYSEQSVRLPETFWCYDPLDGVPEVNALPAKEKGHISFGCLTNVCKVNSGVLTVWAEVLKAVGGSRLTLLAGEGSHRQRVLDLLAERGVGCDRVTFLARRPRSQYLGYYHDIDIGLDTVPCNGHTTSLDSFWMAVPVVTLVGQTVMGRAGLSQLTNLGLPELIAFSSEQFVRIAVELALDLAGLSDLRSSLRERMRASPLMDAPPFARGIEAAFRQMWRHAVQKQDH